MSLNFRVDKNGIMNDMQSSLNISLSRKSSLLLAEINLWDPIVSRLTGLSHMHPLLAQWSVLFCFSLVNYEKGGIINLSWCRLPYPRFYSSSALRGLLISPILCEKIAMKMLICKHSCLIVGKLKCFLISWLVILSRR